MYSFMDSLTASLIKVFELISHLLFSTLFTIPVIRSESRGFGSRRSKNRPSKNRPSEFDALIYPHSEPSKFQRFTSSIRRNFRKITISAISAIGIYFISPAGANVFSDTFHSWFIEPIFEQKSIEALPNEIYFYGVAIRPGQEGSRNILFEKNGTSLTGLYFKEIASDPAFRCFKGSIKIDLLSIYVFASPSYDGFDIYSTSEHTGTYSKSKYASGEEYLMEAVEEIDLSKFQKFPRDRVSAKNQELFSTCQEILRPRGYNLIDPEG